MLSESSIEKNQIEKNVSFFHYQITTNTLLLKQFWTRSAVVSLNIEQN